MTKQLRLLKINQFLVVFCLLISARPGRAQSIGSQVLQHTSYQSFLKEVDTLIDLRWNDTIFPGSDYQVFFFDKAGHTNRVLKRKIITIKQDSLFTQFESSQGIVGDIFSKNPSLDKTSEGVYVEPVTAHHKKWMLKLSLLAGYFSQVAVVNDKIYYSQNRIRCIILKSDARVIFSAVIYGPLEIDYYRMAGKNASILRELADFLY